MATFRDLLSAAKAEITEVSTETAAEHIDQGYTVLDVREPDEYQEGALGGAIHIPRGHLEAQIENRIPDKSTPVVVYCAGGVRPAFAARTMQELGYEAVESMDGGYGRWKDEGRDWKRPATLDAEQMHRYKRHLLLPEVGIEGQKKLRDAKAKTYEYRILHRPVRSPLHHYFAWWIAGPLNAAAMQEAAQALSGEHNFAAFRSTGGRPGHAVRQVREAVWRQEADEWLTFSITANGFLRGMVRSLVGTTVEIGKGKYPAAYVKDVLDKQDRRLAGPTAPPQGLFLVEVEY